VDNQQDSEINQKARPGETLPLQDGELILYRDILPDAEECLLRLRDDLPWRQDHLTLGRRIIALPRLQCWHGEPHCHYSYSRLALDPLPFTPLLQRLRELAAEVAGGPFNCVLCNYYRDGRDSVGWHADDEPELGPEPLIASYSFGATRRLHLRRKDDHGTRLHLDLPHNSLLVMRGALQRCWQHQIPKTASSPARINLTYRYISHP